MIWIIAIIFITLLVYFSNDFNYNVLSNGFILLMFSFIFLSIFSNIICETEIEIVAEKKNIISLNDTNTTYGQYSNFFFIGNGYINNKNIYSFYSQTMDGGYKRENIDASITTIYEDENDAPYILYNKKHIKFKPIKNAFWLLLFSTKRPSSINQRNISIELHIPKNTIVRNIQLDNIN